MQRLSPERLLLSSLPGMTGGNRKCIPAPAPRLTHFAAAELSCPAGPFLVRVGACKRAEDLESPCSDCSPPPAAS